VHPLLLHDKDDFHDRETFNFKNCISLLYMLNNDIVFLPVKIIWWCGVSFFTDIFVV